MEDARVTIGNYGILKVGIRSKSAPKSKKSVKSLSEYRLDTLRAPPLKPDVANAIGVRYGRLPLKAKTKLHMDQMQVEIRRLNLLVAQGLGRVSDLESEIKNIETLQARRAEQIRILKSVQIRATALRREIKTRKAALDQPLPVESEFGPDADYEEICRSTTVAADLSSSATAVNQSEKTASS